MAPPKGAVAHSRRHSPISGVEDQIQAGLSVKTPRRSGGFLAEIEHVRAIRATPVRIGLCAFILFRLSFCEQSGIAIKAVLRDNQRCMV